MISMQHINHITSTARPAGRTARRFNGDPAGTMTTGGRLYDRPVAPILEEDEGTITLDEYRLRTA